jgi:hypothetical protein
VPRVFPSRGTRPRATVRKPGCRLPCLPACEGFPSLHPAACRGLVCFGRPVPRSRFPPVSVLFVRIPVPESRFPLLSFGPRFPVPAFPVPASLCPFTLLPIYPFSHLPPRPFAPSSLVKDFTFISVSAKTRLTSISTPQKPIKKCQKVIKNDQKPSKNSKKRQVFVLPSLTFRRATPSGASANAVFDPPRGLKQVFWARKLT